jgi:SAM-dependent methyltransferase
VPSDDHERGDRPIAEAAYDELADEYVAETEESAYNADLAIPGTKALVPDVAGKRVLDAGCGAGAYAGWLADEGAEVVGVDVSEAMLARARERAGDRVEFRRHDLSDPLAFAEDDGFDGVVSGLALSYVEDWRSVFAEFARVLTDGGFVVFSTTHPFDEFPLPGDADYFAVERDHKEWSVDVPYYRRPLSEVLNPVLEAGLRIDRVSEPRPTEGFREKRPERYEKESRRPVFLVVRAVN